jgi:hypothetical protein
MPFDMNQCASHNRVNCSSFLEKNQMGGSSNGGLYVVPLWYRASSAKRMNTSKKGSSG